MILPPENLRAFETTQYVRTEPTADEGLLFVGLEKMVSRIYPRKHLQNPQTRWRKAQRYKREFLARHKVN